MSMQNKRPKNQAGERHSIVARRIEVVFALECANAKEVYLCGDFNQWSPKNLPMLQRDKNDHWEKRVALTPGRYEYKFRIDGEWMHDAKARDNTPNTYGSLNSVVEVH